MTTDEPHPGRVFGRLIFYFVLSLAIELFVVWQFHLTLVDAF